MLHESSRLASWDFPLFPNEAGKVVPHEFVDGLASWDFPLFPNEAGKVVTKNSMATTIMHAALNLHVPFRLQTGARGFLATALG